MACLQFVCWCFTIPTGNRFFLETLVFFHSFVDSFTVLLVYLHTPHSPTPASFETSKRCPSPAPWRSAHYVCSCRELDFPCLPCLPPSVKGAVKCARRHVNSHVVGGPGSCLSAPSTCVRVQPRGPTVNVCACFCDVSFFLCVEFIGVAPVVAYYYVKKIKVYKKSVLCSRLFQKKKCMFLCTWKKA